MTIIGILLALFTATVVVFAAWSLLKDHFANKKNEFAAQPVMPYMAPDTEAVINDPVLFVVASNWWPFFSDEAVHWANTSLINHYYDLQEEKDMDAYVLIGIGGSPEQPDELYVIPLNNIPRYMHYLTARFLKPYARRASELSFQEAE